MKIKLGILDSDTVYLDRISSAINARYPDRIELYSFTDKNLAVESAASEKIDVFLVNEEFDIDRSGVSQRCGFAYITGNSDAVSIRGERSIAKFQRLDLFYNQILDIYSERCDTDNIVQRKCNTGTRLNTFISAAGGVGNSAMAAAFARFAAANDKKVLYINLELFGDAGVFFDGVGYSDFSDAIYAVKSRKINLCEKLESMVRKDSCGVYFYKSVKTPADLPELSCEDMELLVKTICESGIYDYIVIDLYPSMDDGCRYLLNQSSKIIMTVDSSEISAAKTERACKYFWVMDEQNILDVSGKLFVIKNKSQDYKSYNISQAEYIGAVPFYDCPAERIAECVSGAEIFKKLL